jgi:hypothetical protein
MSYRAVIFYASGLSPMKHYIGLAETPEQAILRAGEEFFGNRECENLTYQPATGIIFYYGDVPCGCVFKVEEST